ncbi:MAG: chorismate mutase [Proteobacteria bacterium]|nr:chorismate mutase [Pseudomonadota bacterium]MDA1059862.1 chorismate mutase [Pseudomonadota bacterium]
MTIDDTKLDALRREIDEIDTRLLAAIAARTEVVRRIGEAKGGGPILRPGREAKVLRALLAGPATGLPAPVVGRIWRELIAAYCSLQGTLEVAVCAPEKSVGYWDLARDHFGSATHMSLHKSPSVVLRAVSEGQATVGILPLPQDGEADPWWRYMSGDGDNMPRIIGRLPFVDNPGARFEDLQAMVVGCLPYDEGGDDVSWLVASTSEQISRRSLTDHLKAVDLGGRAITSFAERGTGDAHLFEVDGYVTATDPRLAAFAKRVGGNAWLSAAGSYARPFSRA